MQSCPLSPLLFQNSSGNTNWRNKAREGNERDTKRIAKVKLSLFSDDIIQKFTEYTENFQQHSTISAKEQGTKSTLETSGLLYNNKHTKKEIMEALLFTIAPKTINCLEINLTKEMKNVHNKNFKHLKKECCEIIFLYTIKMCLCQGTFSWV